MRFLANENIPVETVQTLRKEGVDISSVKDLIPGAADEEVLVKEKGAGRQREIEVFRFLGLCF